MSKLNLTSPYNRIPNNAGHIKWRPLIIIILLALSLITITCQLYGMALTNPDFKFHPVSIYTN